MKQDATRIAFSKKALLIRTWNPNPWGFLPPGLEPPAITVRTRQGLPTEIAESMSVRGVEFTGYPYPRLAQISRGRCLQEIDTVTLENQRFRVVVAVKLGPRILEIHDKANTAPLTLPVAQMNTSMFGLTGTWFIGGVEFNPFRLGHTVFIDQELPVDEVRFSDGTGGIRIRGIDELVNMRFTILIRLFPGRVAWRVELENLLDTGQPLYWYTNIAVPAGEDTMFLYEPGPVANHALDPGFLVEEWPCLDGHDASRWGGHTNKMISGYFYRYQAPYMGFFDPWPGVAMMHHADIRVLKGRKLWSLGAREHGAAWYSRLYEPGLENYCEMQAGVSPVQLVFSWIGPREVIQWTESLTSFPFSPSESYSASWRDFCDRSDELNIQTEEAKTSWEAQPRKNFVPMSPRQQSTWDALSVMREKNDELLRTLTAEEHLAFGWRAGAAWRHVLRQRYEQGDASDWVCLQYAADLAAQGELEEALRVLPDTTPGHAMAKGQTFRLKSAILRRQGKMSQACEAAETALSYVQDDPLLWREALECYRKSGDIPSRRNLLRACPDSVSKTDAIRYEAAWLHFDTGDFSAAVAALSSEMLDIGEGVSDPWYLWRESLIAWGLASWEKGAIADAYCKFVEAADLAPQFGVGRREWDANETPFFYRWWLAREEKNQLMEDALLTQLMRRQPHPSSENALYLLRIASAAGHPSAEQRRTAIETWWQAERAAGHSEPIWCAAMLDSLDSKRSSPLWEKLPETDMRRYRARFESRHHL